MTSSYKKISIPPFKYYFPSETIDFITSRIEEILEKPTNKNHYYKAKT